MAFINLSNLRSSSFQKAQNLNEDVRLLGEPHRHYIFLSYRHSDRKYVPQVANFLKTLGKGIYVDFLYEELAKAPNSEVAYILRTRISQCKKLIQLITPNSGLSKWMPWELGLGDGLLGYSNSVTLPGIEGYNRSIDQEYLNMYGHIKTTYSRDKTIEDWAVIYPNNSAIWFKDWLISK